MPDPIPSYTPSSQGSLGYTPGFQTTPIERDPLLDLDYAYLALLPIFAAAIAPYKARMVNPEAWLRGGIRAVFDWWCANGVLMEGEVSLTDAAMDRAWMVATQIYPDADTVLAAFDFLMPYFDQRAGACALPGGS
jgi:hypothetical protein